MKVCHATVSKGVCPPETSQNVALIQYLRDVVEG